jgi:RNA polymerase sigma-70 factor, ECF subfamily
VNPAERRFTTLVEANGTRVLAYLVRRVDSPADAADLLSEVLAITWRRVEDLPDDDPAAVAWLYGIARGVLANHRRSQARQDALADRLRNHLAGLAVPTSTPSVEVIAVRAALARLAPKDRELVTLVAWDGMTADEIAVMLNTSPAAVRQRLSRARHKLRTALREEDVPDHRAPSWKASPRRRGEAALSWKERDLEDESGQLARDEIC